MKHKSFNSFSINTEHKFVHHIQNINAKNLHSAGIKIKYFFLGFKIHRFVYIHHFLFANFTKTCLLTSTYDVVALMC